MLRSREWGTSSAEGAAGARPAGDPGCRGITLWANGRSKGEKRRSGGAARGVQAGAGQNPREAGSSRGDRPPERTCAGTVVRIRCWSNALEAQKKALGFDVWNNPGVPRALLS